MSGKHQLLVLVGGEAPVKLKLKLKVDANSMRAGLSPTMKKKQHHLDLRLNTSICSNIFF